MSGRRTWPDVANAVAECLLLMALGVLAGRLVFGLVQTVVAWFR